MGRIKTSFVKHIALDLFEKHHDNFTIGFSKNKEVVDEFVEMKSKRLRNIVAGYLTSLKTQQSRK